MHESSMTLTVLLNNVPWDIHDVAIFSQNDPETAKYFIIYPFLAA